MSREGEVRVKSKTARCSRRDSSRGEFRMLERQFCAELDAAVASDSVRHIAEIAGGIGAKALIWLIELRCIRNAEGIGAEFQADALFDRKAPEYRGVEIEEPRSAEGPARCIAQNAHGGLTERSPALRHVIDDIARSHIEPRRAVRTGAANAVQYAEWPVQVRHLCVARGVQRRPTGNVQG